MKNERRPPRRVTANSLGNVAQHYLARFAASEDGLRQVLRRRIRKSAEVHDIDIDEAHGWVEDLIIRYRGAGLLDDHTFAAGRARSLHRRGTSRRAIGAKLAVKGIASELARTVLDELADEIGGDTEFTAAAALARRRRLGPYKAAEKREDARQKDLAALARAGFTYQVANKVIGAESIEELEAALEDANGPGGF
jgi:regulatory protein